MKRVLATLAMIGVVASAPLTALAAPETMPDGTQFDAEYYAQANPDVVAVYGTDANLLYQHYVTSGKAEGRSPFDASQYAMILEDGTVFDPAYYAAANPDVAAAIGTNPELLLQHYETCGKAEGRKPSDLTGAEGAPKEATAPVNPAELPFYATFRGQIITAENAGYGEYVNASVGLLSAPEASVTKVEVEVPYFQLVSSDGSADLLIIVLVPDRNLMQSNDDIDKCFFRVEGNVNGQPVKRVIAYGPEMQRLENAYDLVVASLVSQFPVYTGDLVYKEYSDNVVLVSADHMGLLQILAENDISSLKEYSKVMVQVSRVATDADKAGRAAEPQIVATVTAIQ